MYGRITLLFELCIADDLVRLVGVRVSFCIRLIIAHVYRIQNLRHGFARVLWLDEVPAPDGPQDRTRTFNQLCGPLLRHGRVEHAVCINRLVSAVHTLPAFGVDAENQFRVNKFQNLFVERF